MISSRDAKSTSIDRKSQQPFAEGSFGKAWKYLNTLVMKAGKILDAPSVMWSCSLLGKF